MTAHLRMADLLDRRLDSDALMARAVELCCPVRDRRRHCLTFIVCDDEHRIRQAVAITDLPAEPDTDELSAVLSSVNCALLDIGPTMLVVRGKPHDRVSDADRSLHQHLLDRCCPEYGEPGRLLGFYVAGPTSVHRMPDARALRG